MKTVSLLRVEPDCLSLDRPGSSRAREHDSTLVGDPPDRLQLDGAPKGTLKNEPPEDEVPDDLALGDLALDDYSFSNEPCDRETADRLQRSSCEDGSLTGEHLDDPPDCRQWDDLPCGLWKDEPPDGSTRRPSSPRCVEEHRGRTSGFGDRSRQTYELMWISVIVRCLQDYYVMN